MADKTTYEAAHILGVAVATFRKHAAASGIKAASVQQTGKRGRPADLWTDAQIKKIAEGR